MPLTSTTAAIATFDALKSHLAEWFSQPDIEALEVTLAVAASHFTSADPTWLFVQAPPSTGKTSINIQAIKTVKSAYIMGDMTAQTFLSGKTPRAGQAERSLLARLGSPILLMKDFTTILSKRPDDRAMIVSQLREIYDGTFTKDTGESGRLYWQGKVTVIAACTPALEREWAIHRDLGERFLTVRWIREPGVSAANCGFRQRGHEAQIAARTAMLGKELIEAAPLERGALSIPMQDRIAALSEIVACARNRVIRDSHGDREIIDLQCPEGPTRIAKALAGIVVNYAALFHRDPNDEDVRLAVRVAMNSIPSSRYKILAHIPCDVPIGFSDLARMARLPKGSLHWHLDELMGLRLVQEVKSGTDATYSFTSELAEIWQMAFPSIG